MIQFRAKFAALALFCLATLTGGCTNGRAPESVKTLENLQEVIAQIGKGQEQVDKVIIAINQLQAGGDLNAAFKNYNSAVSDVEAAGDRVKARREAMAVNRQAYIEKWQKDLETIDNPEVRSALAERKQKVAANFDRIGSDTDKVRDSYLVFRKDIQELRTALALDLNTAGVAALKKPLDTAKADGQTLKGKLAYLQGTMTDIAGSMSPNPGK